MLVASHHVWVKELIEGDDWSGLRGALAVVGSAPPMKQGKTASAIHFSLLFSTIGPLTFAKMLIRKKEREEILFYNVT